MLLEKGSYFPIIDKDGIPILQVKIGKKNDNNDNNEDNEE